LQFLNNASILKSPPADDNTQNPVDKNIDKVLLRAKDLTCELSMIILVANEEDALE
jgi:hypothetical protein